MKVKATMPKNIGGMTNFGFINANKSKVRFNNL